jgi:hypothetical protein
MPNQDQPIVNNTNDPVIPSTDTAMPSVMPIVSDTPPAPPTVSDVNPPASSSMSTEPIADFPPPPIVVSAEAGSAPASVQPLPETPATGTDQTLPPLNVSPVVVTGGSGGGLGKKMGRKGFVATVLGVFLLLGGLGVGLYLTGQKQDIREKAYIPPGDEAFKVECDLYTVNVTEVENTSCPKIDTCTSGTVATNNISKYTSTWTVTLTAKTGFVSTDPASVRVTTVSNYCPDSGCGTERNGKPWCDTESAKDPPHEETITLIPGQTKTYTASSTSASGVACGSYQTFINVQPLNCTAPPGATPPPGGIPITRREKDCTDATECRKDGFCQTGLTCTGAGNQYKCKEIRAYKVTGLIVANDPTNWTLLTATDLQNLEEGDIVYYTVVGTSSETAANGGFDKAEFTLNGSTTPIESTNLKPKSTTDTSGNIEFYLKYVITDDVDFSVKGRMHHVTAGWM